MFLFYAPDIATGLTLPEAESQHCVRVLRKQIGDLIDITDGQGHFYKAEITGAHPKQCVVKILETHQQPPLWHNRVEIAIAPTKNLDRVEWFAEKATEIGIDKITLLKTHHSERKDVKVDRIHKILIAAMKQSMKARVPELQAMTAFKQFVQQPFDGQKYIAHCNSGDKTLLSELYASTIRGLRASTTLDMTPVKPAMTDKNALILIGPEGDFSEDEVAEALKTGFQPVSLGETRLRTETAALYALQTIHIINQLSNP
ncbi:MAG: 16S rRNA (uracil(1498)-N(3))-methyltransferase [Candidatus Symbiothrix sp.]|jgi:16S rRNA (uracil1498-N3)-methyltransferase|nr:16S rRNA (uracil(1498)-N(3))-methyltransferase [Candidatus Symbiothrix sp.]